MQRFAAVWHASPQKLVGVLFALLLAAMMAVGSGANFNTTSANPGNVVTAGNLEHTNTGAKMTVTKLKPGETRTAGTVKIANTGDIDGIFTVAKSIVSDSNVDAGKAAFADKLRLTIKDTTTGDVVYDDGVLSAMDARDAGTIQPGSGNAHTYEFSVRFPDGGTGGADNDYKGASIEVDFNWEGVNTP